MKINQKIVKRINDRHIVDIQEEIDKQLVDYEKREAKINIQRAGTVEMLTVLLERMGGDSSEIENKVFDEGDKYTNNNQQVENIETLYRKINFIDDYARQLYLARALSETNNNTQQSRTRIRNLLNTVRIDLNDYLNFYEDFIMNSGMFVDNHDFNLSKQNCEYLRNQEWITCYRGFNTREDETIRMSKNKNKADYYRQMEGMGFSFTLNKKLAFLFSIMYQSRLLRNTSKFGYDVTHTQMKDDVHLHRSLIGRATVGRYVVHRDNIKGVEFGRAESEVMCDYRDAKLIDYKFVSDLKLNSKDFEKISQGALLSSQLKQLDKIADGKIHKWWKNSYKVTKDKATIFLKTKK